jgi:hypothetical protein
MKRLATLSLIAGSLLLAQPFAYAEEGKVSEPTVTPDVDRSSHYSRGTAVKNAAATKQAKRHVHAKTKAVAAKAQRSVTMSARADHFYIYDATSTLRADRDGDGYHSEFRVRFDAEVRVGDALVYAKLYLRRRGESQWYLYRETDDFWIYGESDDDDYYVTTTLDAGYATDDYDVLIDLYESGYSGVVATLGPAESGALSFLPLEEAGLDVPIEMPGYSISDVFTDLIVDDDGDGFYSGFSITIDPDAEYESRLIYARIWVRARGGEWIEEYVTEDWRVETSGASDAYVLDADWVSGYPSSYYDVQVDLYDSSSDLLIASAGSDWPDFAQIPLEDQSRDLRPSSPTPGGGGSSSSREGGGGSMGLWALLAMTGIGALRRAQRDRVARRASRV